MNKFAIFLLLNIFLLSSCKKEHIEFVERNNELKSGMMTMGSIPLIPILPEVPVYISNNYGRLYASGNNVYVSTSQSSTSAMWYVQNLYPSLYSPGPVLTNVNSLKYLTTTTKDGTLTLSNTPKYFATCTNDYLNYEIIPSTLNLILTADKRLSTSNNKVLIQTYNSSNIYQKWNIEVAGECEIININYSLIDNNNIADIETEVIEGYLSNSVGSTATLSLA